MIASQQGLEGLIRSLKGRSIAVIGDLILDHYVQGRADRLSPEAPIQVLEVAEEYHMPGGAANVAMKAEGLGCSVRLVGLVGQDDHADRLGELLDDQPGIQVDLIADPGRSTTAKTRFIAHNQQLLRVDRERRAVPEGAVLDRLVAAARLAAAQADAVILEDYGKGVLGPEVIAAALEGARESGAPVIVDPNGRNYRRYAGATVLTPNLRETEVAAEHPVADLADLEIAARKLVEQTGATLAVTRESQGISLFRRNETGEIGHDHIPTVPVAVFDVTGAGDAVAAALAMALASGLEMADACMVANLAGRAVVRQFGVGSISIAHLLEEAGSIEGRPTKVLNAQRAAERVQEVRRAGQKIAFTNGCFDILHYGHAHLLQFARSQADFLVLGLNTDASIRRLKGADRPIVSEDQRSTMLALYPFVDLVVLFDEETPMELIQTLRPDVLVKGGDYTPETVVGRDFVESYGGRVAICPRLEGFSTTDLVHKILGRRVA